MILLGLSVRALDPSVCEAPCKPLFMNAGMDPDHDHNIHYKVAIFEWLMVFTAQIGYFYTFNHDMEGEAIITGADESEEQSNSDEEVKENEILESLKDFDRRKKTIPQEE